MGEILGWVMTGCFVCCGIPQAIDCYNKGNARGINKLFILLWLIGEVCGIVYSFSIKPFPFPLFINYSISTAITAVILKYMYFPRNDKLQRRHRTV